MFTLPRKLSHQEQRSVVYFLSAKWLSTNAIHTVYNNYNINNYNNNNNNNNNNNLICVAPVCAKKTSVELADRINFCD